MVQCVMIDKKIKRWNENNNFCDEINSSCQDGNDDMRE